MEITVVLEMRGSTSSLGRWRLKTKLAYPKEEVDKSDKLAQKFGNNFTLWLILFLHEVGSSFMAMEDRSNETQMQGK